MPASSQRGPIWRNYIQAHDRGPRGRIFLSTQGEEIRLSNFSHRVLSKALQAANLPSNVTLYTLRHSAASMMASLGVAPTKAAAILGLSPSQFLNTYAHAYPSDLKDVSELLATARRAQNDANVIPLRHTHD